MMKRIYFVIVLGIIFLLNVHIAHAEFLIELRNDRTICVENYRADGDQIALYVKSGTLKIAKYEIRSIIEDERCMEEKNDTPGDLKEKIAEKGSPNAKEGIERYKKAKREIQERLEESKEVYFKATNRYEKDEARGKMLSISSEVCELQDEVTAKNGGIIPEWWQE
jgi:chromosome condensin MukBEF ATPase and DNA-binding subunit MukB